MWLSEGLGRIKKCYFYPEKFYCYNLYEKARFGVASDTRKQWENGSSTRIGADCLGEWSDG